MADIILGILGIVILMFGFVIAVGAPYLPTLEAQKRQALEMLGLKSGSTMLELGCGDGRVMAAAAAQGIRCIGYEINPLLVLTAFWTTRKYRDLVTIKMRSYWGDELPDADGIFVFLLPKYMAKLDNKIIQESSKPVKLISVAFEIPGKEVDRRQNGLFLYEYK
jgi:hypothetical protein